MSNWRLFSASYWKRFLSCFTILASLAGLTTIAQPAAGLTQDSLSNCSSGGLKYRFTGSEWSGTAPNGYNWDTKPTLRNYANDWEDEFEYNAASRVVDMINSSGEIDIFFVPDSQLTGIANAQCTSTHKRIRISDDYAPPTIGPDSNWYADMGRLVQHELGHTMGLWHTGHLDSHDSRKPVMATCAPFEDSSDRSLSQDDWESHQRVNGALNPETMSANVGFNRGFSYYGRSAGSVWNMSGSTLLFRRQTPSDDHKFFQTTAVAGSSGNMYAVRINWARPYSGAAAGVWASMYARGVTYGPGGCSGNPQPVSGHTYSGTRTAGSTWYFKSDVGDSVPTYPTSMTHMDTLTNWMIGNTVDIQIRVSSNAATTSGASQYLRFDNVRLRECSNDHLWEDCEA